MTLNWQGLTKCNGHFCSCDFAVWNVWAPALLEQFTEVLFSIDWHRAEEELLHYRVSVKIGVCAADCFCSYFEVILKFSSVTKLLQCSCWKQTMYCHLSIYYQNMACLDSCNWKNCNLLAAFWDSRRYLLIFHSKMCTTRHTVISHSALSNTILRAPYLIALPWKCEKQSTITRTIEISLFFFLRLVLALAMLLLLAVCRSGRKSVME